MINADWIALGAIVLFALLGAIFGFGKGLKFFTSGIFGIVISVFVCYCLGGFVLELQFVQDLLAKISSGWVGKEGFFYDFLTKIHLEIIIYYIILFIVVCVLRRILVSLLKHVVEINFLPVKIINKVLGAALFVCAVTLLALVVFQIVYWVGGSTAENFRTVLADSAFKLDRLFENNPLNSIVEQVKSTIAAV